VQIAKRFATKGPIEGAKSGRMIFSSGLGRYRETERQQTEEGKHEEPRSSFNNYKRGCVGLQHLGKKKIGPGWRERSETSGLREREHA